MASGYLQFPAGFIWGVATSSHQNEGNNTNNDFWQWEQAGHTRDGTISGLACDWWHNAEADFDRAAALGLNTLRLSLEWSRLEPKEGYWDDTAFERYRQMLLALHERGLRPMVTLHHFTNPLWLAKQDGWLNPTVVDYFARYTAQVIERLGDLCSWWCTLNEPNVYLLMAYLAALWPPGYRSIQAFSQAARHQVLAHAVAVDVIKQHTPQAQVSFANHIAAFDPHRPWHLGDRIIAHLLDTIMNRWALDSLQGGCLRPPFGTGWEKLSMTAPPLDYLAVNYYGSHPQQFKFGGSVIGLIEQQVIHEERAWDTPWEMRETSPQGLYQLLLAMWQRYQLPIYITENGFCEMGDEKRPAYIISHLAAVHRAIAAGVDVRGYYYWTLVDNYEWAEGWTTRFGLYHLDPETQKRTPRPSANLYREIVRQNGISEDLVKAYAPQLLGELFATGQLVTEEE